MLKIRLTRIGAKKKPFYRVVVIDERAKRNGAYIELLGTYNPLTEPKDIKLKQERIDYWVKQGAQLSIGFLRVIGKAPQRPPRKPKKEKKVEAPKVAEETKTEESAKTEETAATEEAAPEQPEEIKTEEIPAETTSAEASEETTKSDKTVIATPPWRGKQSSPDDNPTQIATGRQGDPRNDKVEESGKKDEGSA